ncbi:GH92 family glycosyl hydrolase [Niabella yanshanensis]|uniref:GH92 family glycosyl hydrolase n=1 Tax=Niabella yanshanensis TaxID=577386 RepID=A0ABZ0W861_9BACT|nr:GH92 family glycosyl hydrolase [Niabella yanshanensis]WQD38682.1 GH92 family glycosyl hydrolase [Niabella yanshanensis]
MIRSTRICAAVCSMITILLWSGTLLAQQTDYTQFVDPNIGTAHCRWFHYTPGAQPFGMAKPAPSTNGSYGTMHGWDASGYDYRHESIEGFANFHEFQLGGIVFTATTGPLQTVPGKLEDPESGYRSRFDRKDEVSTAGYYSVFLKDYQVRAELTATERVAYHRYTFPATRQAHILFDIGSVWGESGPVKDAEVRLLPDGRVEGWVTTLPVYVQKYQPGAEVTMFFSAVLSKKPKAYGTFNGADIHQQQTVEKGKGAGLYLSFATNADEAITIKAGLSLTSVKNARLNLEQEAKKLSFDAARQQSKNHWNTLLGRIDVQGGVHKDKIKFYTGLYHALLGRGLASDVNGAYPMNTGGIGQIPLDEAGKPIHDHYNTDAVWGAYWNLTQLWALAYPEYYADFIKSQLLVYKDAGWLGDGIVNSRYVSGVGTNFVSLIMAGAYLAGIQTFDVEQAYAASRKNEFESASRPHGAGKMDVDRFLKYGYVNHLDSGKGSGELWQFSASHTLEYAFSSFAMSNWARALGKSADAKLFDDLSRAWEKLWDADLQLVRPRLANGQFIENFDPAQPWRGFQEGNAYQYTYFVPHNPERLIQKVGMARFNMRLDSTFVLAEKALFGGGAHIDAFAGIAGIYNHGNQPNLHVSWLFNYSGKPSLTQKWVRAICDKFYGTEGVHGYGFGQDEDQGQLGAWYVMAAMGLFDVKGLTASENTFGLSGPLFDRITISLNNAYYPGKQFAIVAKNAGGQNKYIQSIRLNDKDVHQPFIPWKSITQGAELRLEMGKQPRDRY